MRSIASAWLSFTLDIIREIRILNNKNLLSAKKRELKSERELKKVKERECGKADEIMKATMWLDQMSHDAMENLPRKMSASKLMRTLLVAATTNNREWKQHLKENEEAREVQAYLRQKFLGKFD
jgi:hypothetical protein